VDAAVSAVLQVCPKCNASLEEGDLFCEECGADLAEAAASAASAAGAPATAAGAPRDGAAVQEAPVGQEAVAGHGGYRPGATVWGAPAPASGGPLVQVDEPDLSAAAGQCTECGGQVDPDGYCGQCGSPAPAPRDHWLERPASWVAAMCDRGLRHPHNEDAVAVAAGAVPGSFAALVVCDGVSSSTGSAVAGLAAVRAAREVLVAAAVPEPQRGGARVESSTLAAAAAPAPASTSSDAAAAYPATPSDAAAATHPAVPGWPPPDGPAVPPPVIPAQPGATPTDGRPGAVRPGAVRPGAVQPEVGSPGPGPSDPADGGPVTEDLAPAGSPSGSVQARAGMLAARLVEAGLQANAAVVRSAGDPPRPNPPSCTFAAALVEGPLLVAGWVGDSRIYWLPDAGRAVQVSSDDSWAGEAIAAGIPREDAERAPQAHAITRWFGVDAPDPRAHTAAHRLDGSGWVLVCSDGLWNYCSPAAELQGLVALTVQRTGSDPAALASELVAWAKQQGGHDNITVALARVR
jgi:serine/threonine protein phosphatase PrpC